MKQFKILLGVILAAVAVAITYHIFENAIHGAIQVVWYDWFDTDNNRLLVVPLAIGLGLIFYGTQHVLDKKSENAEEHGLGNMPKPTLVNFSKVLSVGFFSLLAGATLGPEAILVPACMIVGGLVGKAFLKQDSQAIKLLTAAAIMALFTAFFNSIAVGILSLLLVMKQAKVSFKPALLIIAIIASVSSFYTLKMLDGEAYVQLPPFNWSINANTIGASGILLAVGYLLVMAMDGIHTLLSTISTSKISKTWWTKGLLAGVVLAILYLLGGPLVEFTGNKSIEPMFQQVGTLGIAGLLWVLIIKIVLISWSKAIGYRGGMIFPTIFLAAVATAIMQFYVNDLNLIYGIIAVITGALMANKESHILV